MCSSVRGSVSFTPVCGAQNGTKRCYRLLHGAADGTNTGKISCCSFNNESFGVGWNLDIQIQIGYFEKHCFPLLVSKIHQCFVALQIYWLKLHLNFLNWTENPKSQYHSGIQRQDIQLPKSFLGAQSSKKMSSYMQRITDCSSYHFGKVA